MINLEIWGSGNGSNAEAIIRYFKDHAKIAVQRVASNRKDAGILEKARSASIESHVLQKQALADGRYVKDLQNRNIDFIILAGFLMLVPEAIVRAFPHRMLNIHPALLPKYGGKGMYGDFVHQAVKESYESETGISIHLVNEQFDEGAVIAQYRVKLDPKDTVEMIKEKVQKLEHQYFPRVIEQFVLEQTEGN